MAYKKATFMIITKESQKKNMNFNATGKINAHIIVITKGLIYTK